MPACYAHTLFGKKVFQQLDKNLQTYIHKYLDYYYIGLLGPDILFYYNALTHNRINQLGRQLHKQNADTFFIHARECIYHSQNQDAAFVYMLGFLNHYILDSECHPYIGMIEKQENITHSEIESDFDRQLLDDQGFIPCKKDLIHHIHYKKEMSSIIAPFFHLDVVSMHKCLKDMFLYLGLLHCPNQFKKKIIFCGMKVAHVYEQLHGLVVQNQAHPRCQNSTQHLIEILNSSISLSTEMIKEYIAFLNHEKDLNQRFYRNFE